jgi:hypothetical protein
MLPGGAFGPDPLQRVGLLEAARELLEGAASAVIQHTRPDAEQLGWR